MLPAVSSNGGNWDLILSTFWGFPYLPPSGSILFFYQKKKKHFTVSGPCSPRPEAPLAGAAGGWGGEGVDGAAVGFPVLCWARTSKGLCCAFLLRLLVALGVALGDPKGQNRRPRGPVSQRYPPTESCSVPVHPVPVSISTRRRPPRAARAPRTGGDTGRRQRCTTASSERQPKRAGAAGSGRGDREWPGKGGGGRRERKNLILSQQRDSARNLEWLKTVKESHGSVELSSLSLATAINSRGIYEIKAPRDGPVSCPHPWHSWPWCLQATVNGDGGYLPPEK